MASSQWAQWGALLAPHPDPHDFVRPRASSSTAALPYSSGALHLSHIPLTTARTLRHSLSTISLSAAFVKKPKKSSPVPALPPRLQPLAFTKEPIVDLTLPPYRSPQASGPLATDSAHPPWDSSTYSFNDDSNDETGAAVFAHANLTEVVHRPHLAAPAGCNNERQRQNEFNYDMSYVTGDANPSLMLPSIHPRPHDEHTINAHIPQLESSYFPPTSANSTQSNLDPSNISVEAPLQYHLNRPAPGANFASSTTPLALSASPDTLTGCSASDETHPNYSIDATDMLKFRKNCSNVLSSAPSTTPVASNSIPTSPSIIRALTKKRTPPPPVSSLIAIPADTPAPAPLVAATKPRASLEIQQADISLTDPEAAAREMPSLSAPRESVPSAAALYSPFYNNNANAIDDAPGDINDDVQTALEEPRRLPPSIMPIPSETEVQSDIDYGHPQEHARTQELRFSSASHSYDHSPSLSGPTAKGRSVSLDLQLQRGSSGRMNAAEPKTELHQLPSSTNANNNNHWRSILEDGSRSECEHGATRTGAYMSDCSDGGLDEDEGGADDGEGTSLFKHCAAFSTLSAAAWRSRLSRSECGHGGPRSLGAHHPTGDRPNQVADPACVTPASSRSGAGWTALVVRAFSLRDGREVTLATRSSSSTSGSFDTPTAMSTSTKRGQNKGAKKVLHKRRATTDGAVGGAVLSSVPASASPLSQVSPLPASSTATDDLHHRTTQTSVSTPPSSWADHIHTSPSTSGPSVDPKNAYNSPPPASTTSEKSSTFGFLRRRRLSVGRRGMSVGRGDGGEGRQNDVRESDVGERGTRSMDDEADEARRLRLMTRDGDKRIPPVPGPSLMIATTCTAPPIPRPKTQSHGKLTKPRPAEMTQIPPRRPIFTVGNESDVDLPSSSIAQTHSVQSTTLSSASAGPPPLPRPPLLPHNIYLNPEQPTGPGRRRWTLASAMLDEGVSDASLVRELERIRTIAAWETAQRIGTARLRRGQERSEDEDEEDEMMGEEKAKGGRSTVRSEEGWEIDVGQEIWDNREGMLEHEQARTKSTSSCESPPLSPKSSAFPKSMSASTTSSWLAAQRALLTCRELILTERRYLGLMQTLLSAQTMVPPPPLMLHYVAELVHASVGVLADMERQPSVAGIANAFVRRQGELEAAYVSWCGVVGGWFLSQSDGSTVDEGSEVGSGGSVEGHGAARKRRTAGDADPLGDGSPPVSPLKRTVSTWRKSMPSIPSLGVGGEVVPLPRGRGHRNVTSKREEDAMAPTMPSKTGGTKPTRRHTVRDLAILPTQRVMRYVLLYRDLLSHTPPSSASRVLVERAIEAACRIADKCNRAQGNAAFIVGKPNPPVPEPGFLGTRSGSGASHSSRGSSRRGDTLSLTSRPSSPSTKTTESMSSTSHSTSMSGSTAATSLSHSPSAFVDGASKVQIQAPPGRHVHSGRGMGSVRRTSMSAVSLSLMTSMGLSKGRASMPQPMSGL